MTGDAPMPDDVDDDTVEAVEPIHEALQAAMRDAGEHDDILVHYVVIGEWASSSGNYLSLAVGADTRTWHARGMIAEAGEMVTQGDTYETVRDALADGDADE